WPWTLSALPALLGGGAGFAAATSVYGLAPLPDPQQRSGAYDTSADNSGPIMLTMYVSPLVALPAIGVVYLGQQAGGGLLPYAGIPVGIVTGIVVAWALGR